MEQPTHVSYSLVILFDSIRKELTNRYAIVQVEWSAAGNYVTTTDQTIQIFQSPEECRKCMAETLMDVPEWMDETRLVRGWKVLEDGAIRWSKPVASCDYETYPQIDEAWAIWEREDISEI